MKPNLRVLLVLLLTLVLTVLVGSFWIQFEKTSSVRPAHHVIITWIEPSPVDSFTVYKRNKEGERFYVLAREVYLHTFQDDAVEGGDRPCYMITATRDGVTSFPSDILCTTVPKLPQITVGSPAQSLSMKEIQHDYANL